MQYPLPDEYNPYFQRYLDLVDKGKFDELFQTNTTSVAKFFSELPAKKHSYRYAEGKWTVKDVLMHIVDTERVFSFRMLVAARGDNKTPLPSVDEDLYAYNVDVTNRSMESLISEFTTVREGINFLVQNITEEQSRFKATSGTHPITARAAAFIMMGHTLHHIRVIRERYLQN